MKEAPEKRTGSPLLSLWRKLGPGLVTGAADDDPSGIATHSQIGAQFGFGLSWTFVFSFPLMVVIQQVAAEIGSVTGRGIAHNLRRHYSPWLLRGVVALLLVANIINLGADLGAMGAALQLLAGGPEQLYTLLFGVVCIVLEVWISYPRYAAILKWTTLSLFSYVAVVFVADVPWGTALKSLFVPSIDLTGGYAMAMVAILGTTISPYLFFWQAGQEVEEEHRHHTKPLCVSPKTLARSWPGSASIRLPAWRSVRWCRWQLFSQLRRRCTRTELPTLQLRHRPPRRCDPSPASLRLRCLLPGSLAPGCWRYRCWQDRRLMR